MLCCTSAPPTTGIVTSPESTGHVVGARKQTCGRTARGAAGRGALLGARSRKGIWADIAGIDVLEVACGLVDRGVGAQPPLLLGGDGFALAIDGDDRLRELRARAIGDDLGGARQ